MRTFEVKFRWRDWYGAPRVVTTFVEASDETGAVLEARARIAEIYGLERIQFVETRAAA